MIIAIIISKVLFLLTLCWYWIAEGATEGYTWSTTDRKINNKFIKPGKYDNVPGKEHSKGKYSYHQWRVYGENIGIYLTIIMGIMLGALAIMQILILTSGTLETLWSLILITALQILALIAGSTLIAIFFYERILNMISYNEVFPQKESWDLGKLIVPRKSWQDWIMLAAGVILYYLAF